MTRRASLRNAPGVPQLLHGQVQWIIPIAVFGTLPVGYALFKRKGIPLRAA